MSAEVDADAAAEPTFGPHKMTLGEVAAGFYAYGQADAEDFAHERELWGVGRDHTLGGVGLDDVRDQWYQSVRHRGARTAVDPVEPNPQVFILALTNGETLRWRGDPAAIAECGSSANLPFLVLENGTLVNLAHVVSMTPIG